MADSIKVKEIIDASYSGDSLPKWVSDAIASEEFLLVNTTVRLKVGRDEVYARSVDTITLDDKGNYGVQRGPEFV
jgi:hypothetical protein